MLSLDEAIAHCLEVAEEQDMKAGFETDYQTYTMSETERERCRECANEHRQLAEWLKELKQLREQTRWIPVSERLPMSDEEYHTFLVTDSKGNVALSEFYLSISDKKPYWSGMIDVKAWMPLPEPYKENVE